MLAYNSLGFKHMDGDQMSGARKRPRERSMRVIPSQAYRNERRDSRFK